MGIPAYSSVSLLEVFGMNRVVALGVAAFFGLMTLVLVGGDNQSLALGRRGGCNGCGGASAGRCDGGRDKCCGRQKRERCSGRKAKCCGEVNTCCGTPAPTCCAAPAPTCCGAAPAAPCSNCSAPAAVAPAAAAPAPAPAPPAPAPAPAQ
jgi:hypothetical protein